MIGTHVILEADDGRLTLKRSASNSELRPLEQLPDFGEQFAARYRGDPAFIANTNLSPHFPYAGRLWQASYAQATGDEVDVVMGTDVVALGSLIEATGPVTLPDGRTLTADQAVDFALLGVYEQFPNSAEREEFQEAVATAVFTAVTEGEVSGQALVRALSDMIAQRRVQLWSPRESEQESLMQPADLRLGRCLRRSLCLPRPDQCHRVQARLVHRPIHPLRGWDAATWPTECSRVSSSP